MPDTRPRDFAASPPIRALVVGAGETSCLIHLPVLARLRDQGRLHLAEICDLRRDRAVAAREKFGFSRSSGDALAGLRGTDIDAVYLFGDAHMHAALGMEALEHGKHLFVEKPIAPSHAEAVRMAEAARAGRLVACGGHNRRFYRSLAEVRRHGGKAGWRTAEAVFHKPASFVPPPFGATSWLTANGIHALDALLFVIGSLPDHVAASAEGNSYAALLRWPGGAQATFLCDNSAGERREAYAFHAPGLSCRVEEDGLRVANAGGVRFTPTPMSSPTDVLDGFAAEHAAFLDAIEYGGEPVHGLAALAPSLHLAELIEQGFSGRISWPKPASYGAVPSPKRHRGASLLVVNARGLAPGLTAVPPDWPLVAIEDVLQSRLPRPDIAAALIGTGPSVLTEQLLDRLPNLQIAGLAGLSFAHHRPELLLARGITLVNASAAHADYVAEFALGVAILGRRRAFASDRLMRSGGWGIAAPPTGWRGPALRAARLLRPVFARAGLEPVLLRTWRRTRPLHGIDPGFQAPPRALLGATAGLLGWGANAQALATRLLAAGAEVTVFSENADPDHIRQAGAVPVSLGQALAADIVSLHRGLTPATRHFLGAAELARLRPGTVLINIARAALIEPASLLARLRRGDIVACLDVFELEPPAARDPLRRLTNVFLTSHLAGGATDLRPAAVSEVLQKINRHFDGTPVEPVTQARLRTMT
jgi:phosphoglycerate dehydrogenase-like enzyme/predicted dehydrogenase